MKLPKLLSTAWATSGLKNIIPNNRTSSLSQGSATYDVGFPSITMTPIAQGGKAPSGKDMNGVLHEITAHIVYQNKGGEYTFNAELASAIGGYEKGAVLISDDYTKFFVSLIDNNSVNFNTTDYSKSWGIIATTDLIKYAKPKDLDENSVSSQDVNGHSHKLPVATSDKKGIVKLFSGTDSKSEDMAATSKAVNTAQTAAYNAQITANKKADVHNHVNNLDNLSSSQFFGCNDTATGVPSDLSGANIDLNGIHADAGYQKTQILFVTDTDIRVRYNDDGVNWSNWSKIAMLPEVTKRVLKTSDTMTGHLTIKQGDYSSVRTYNTAGESVRWEVYPSDRGNFGSITYANKNEGVVNAIFLPKKSGTVALTSDVDDVKKIAVTNIRLGSETRITLTHSASYPSGYVVTRITAGGNIDGDDYAYIRPLQKYVNGSWVTISNA